MSETDQLDYDGLADDDLFEERELEDHEIDGLGYHGLPDDDKFMDDPLLSSFAINEADMAKRLERLFVHEIGHAIGH